MSDQLEKPKPPPFFLPVIQVIGLIVAVVVILGLALGWDTRVQYSDAFFWATLICLGLSVGSAVAFSGSVIGSIYRRRPEDGTIQEVIQENRQKTRPARRFATQMLAAAGICFLISLLIGL
jgi:hypothetical protein